MWIHLKTEADPNETRVSLMSKKTPASLTHVNLGEILKRHVEFHSMAMV